jgi:hypothetical protein
MKHIKIFENWINESKVNLTDEKKSAIATSIGEAISDSISEVISRIKKHGFEDFEDFADSFVLSGYTSNGNLMLKWTYSSPHKLNDEFALQIYSELLNGIIENGYLIMDKEDYIGTDSISSLIK